MKVKCREALFEKIDVGYSFENIFKKHFIGIILRAGFTHFHNKKTALKLLCKLTSVVDYPSTTFQPCDDK